MFKQQGGFWLYLMGILAIFVLVYFLAQSSTGRRLISIQPSPNGQNTVVTKVNSTSTIVIPSNKPTIVSANSIDLTKDFTAEIITNKGTLKLDLLEKNAPNTVTNFINLVNSKYYNGTKFYKLVPGVMLQGGSATTKNSDLEDDIYGNPGYVIPDEINWDSLDFPTGLRSELISLGYKSAYRLASRDVEKYSLIMIGPKPNSAGSQFAIILANTNSIQIQAFRGKNTVFAVIQSDYSVMDSLAILPVSSSSGISRPLEDIIIEDIQIFTK